MSVSSGIYDANVLKKTFDEWRQKVGTQKAHETYREILSRHNRQVESSVAREYHQDCTNFPGRYRLLSGRTQK